MTPSEHDPFADPIADAVIARLRAKTYSTKRRAFIPKPKTMNLSGDPESNRAAYEEALAKRAAKKTWVDVIPRAIQDLEKAGWLCARVERQGINKAGFHIKADLWGFVDVVALKSGTWLVMEVENKSKSGTRLAIEVENKSKSGTRPAAQTVPHLLLVQVTTKDGIGAHVRKIKGLPAARRALECGAKIAVLGYFKGGTRWECEIRNVTLADFKM